MEMTMKMKTRLLTGLLVLMSGVALANRQPPGPAWMSIDKLEILLDLDAYQKQEVQKILEARHAARRAKREQMRNAETRPSFDQMQTERATAQAETRTQLAKILSEIQLKKFDVLTERPPLRDGKKGEQGR
jgi:hypothetical protein